MLVAPYTGAWIEIYEKEHIFSFKNVAPYTGAWIEIGITGDTVVQALVAPYTGAWIEIDLQEKYKTDTESRSLHGSVD